MKFNKEIKILKKIGLSNPKVIQLKNSIGNLRILISGWIPIKQTLKDFKDEYESSKKEFEYIREMTFDEFLKDEGTYEYYKKVERGKTILYNTKLGIEIKFVPEILEKYPKISHLMLKSAIEEMKEEVEKIKKEIPNFDSIIKLIGKRNVGWIVIETK